MKRKPKNYIDNKTFLSYLIEYREKCSVAEAEDRPKPQVTEKIGMCLFQIANRLATKPNFSGYMFKDEMVSDGIENAVDAVLKFNPEKSQNPFAYFTQIIWYAFIRRIEKEKKQLYTKKKYYDDKYVNRELVDYSLCGIDSVPYSELNSIQNDYMDELQKNYEEK